MACNSITGLPLACGTEGVLAGVQKLYIIAHKDLAPAGEGGAGDPVYILSEAGLVNDIGLAVDKTYVEIGLLKSTAGIKETMTKNAQNGNNFLTAEITMVLSNLTSANRTFVESVRYQPVSILVKSRTDKWFVTGLNGQLELSALESGTGTTETDTMGYTMTFSGLDTALIREVDATIISDIVEDTTESS